MSTRATIEPISVVYPLYSELYIRTIIVCMEQSRTALWLPCVGIAIKIVKEEPGMKGIATFRPSFGRSCKALSFSSFITSLAVKRTKNLPL